MIGRKWLNLSLYKPTSVFYWSAKKTCVDTITCSKTKLSLNKWKNVTVTSDSLSLSFSFSFSFSFSLSLSLSLIIRVFAHLNRLVNGFHHFIVTGAVILRNIVDWHKTDRSQSILNLKEKERNIEWACFAICCYCFGWVSDVWTVRFVFYFIVVIVPIYPCRGPAAGLSPATRCLSRSLKWWIDPRPWYWGSSGRPSGSHTMPDTSSNQKAAPPIVSQSGTPASNHQSIETPNPRWAAKKNVVRCYELSNNGVSLFWPIRRRVWGRAWPVRKRAGSFLGLLFLKFWLRVNLILDSLILIVERSWLERWLIDGRILFQSRSASNVV